MEKFKLQVPWEEGSLLGPVKHAGAILGRFGRAEGVSNEQMAQEMVT